MTTKDVLAIALEALAANEFHLVEVGKCGNGLHAQTVKAITAIKQVQQAESMWDIERLESARQQANQSPTSLAAQAVYINGLEYELARLLCRKHSTCTPNWQPEKHETQTP